MITTAVSTFEFFESFTLQGDDDSWSRVPLKHLIYLLQCTSLIIPFLVPLTLWYLIIFAWRFHYNFTVSDTCNIINIVVVIWYFQVRKNREKDFLFRSIMALLSLQTLIVFSILTMLTGSWSIKMLFRANLRIMCCFQYKCGQIKNHVFYNYCDRMTKTFQKFH